MQGLLWIIMSVLLVVASIEDMKEKMVHRWLLINMCIVCLMSGMVACIEDGSNLWQLLGGLAIGAGFIGFSLLSGGQLGLADGIVITAIGMLCGGRDCLVVISMASLLMAVLSIGVLVMKKGNRSTRLPFVPALLISFLVTGWMG